MKNIFTEYALCNLKKNRTRTLVTIIGIILSVAMFTAVTESMYSGQQFMINAVKATTGSFEGQYLGISSQNLDKLKNDVRYSSVASLQNIGFAEINSKNEYMPYIRICGISENFSDLVSLRLIEGRMPEKSDEIVISRHMYTNGRIETSLGDKLTLEVGQREIDGEITDSLCSFCGEDEKLVNTQKKTYTVVGICARPDTLVEKREEPGYSAFTLAENDENLSYTAYFSLKNSKEIYDSEFNSYGSDNGYGSVDRINTDLLMYEGVDGGSAFTGLVAGLTAVLIAIIMLGSVSLIYNSFSISVTERTKQYGLLRSLGATKKQMIRSVLSEAMFLCVIAVPVGLVAGCAGIAVTFKTLAPQFGVIAGNMYEGGAKDVVIKLVPNAAALISAAVISVVTVLISAFLPVKRSMKMSAVECIRMSGDITVEKSEKEKGKLMARFFGFEGMLASKNFARNRKKYRTTVFSLALSIILFVSASSLCLYFKKSFDMGVNYVNYDIAAYLEAASEEIAESEKLFDNFAHTDGVDESAVTVSDNSSASVFVSTDCMTAEAQSYFEYTNYCDIKIRFIDDDSFLKLCKENGLKESLYFNSKEPLGVLYDNVILSANENGKVQFNTVKMLKDDGFPLKINAVKCIYDTTDCYYSQITSDGFAEFYDYTNNKTVKVPFEKAFESIELNIGAKVSNPPFYISENDFCICYPKSKMTDFYGGLPKSLFWTGYYKTPEHSAVYEKMLASAIDTGNLEFSDVSSDDATMKALVTLINVFSYGFITLISLIAAANVFNTVSTNIMLRRRELAMLKSVGMSQKGFKRMFNLESLLYGLKSIAIGLPVSLVISFVIWYVVGYSGFNLGFTMPWGQIGIAVVSVFAVVFASMIYSTNKLKKYNTADELKNENI